MRRLAGLFLRALLTCLSLARREGTVRLVSSVPLGRIPCIPVWRPNKCHRLRSCVHGWNIKSIAICNIPWNFVSSVGRSQTPTIAATAHGSYEGGTTDLSCNSLNANYTSEETSQSPPLSGRLPCFACEGRPTAMVRMRRPSCCCYCLRCCCCLFI